MVIIPFALRGTVNKALPIGEKNPWSVISQRHAVTMAIFVGLGLFFYIPPAVWKFIVSVDTLSEREAEYFPSGKPQSQKYFVEMVLRRQNIHWPIFYTSSVDCKNAWGIQLQDSEIFSGLSPYISCLPPFQILKITIPSFTVTSFSPDAYLQPKVRYLYANLRDLTKF